MTVEEATAIISEMIASPFWDIKGVQRDRQGRVLYLDVIHSLDGITCQHEMIMDRFAWEEAKRLHDQQRQKNHLRILRV